MVSSSKILRGLILAVTSIIGINNANAHTYQINQAEHCSKCIHANLINKQGDRRYFDFSVVENQLLIEMDRSGRKSPYFKTRLVADWAL